MARYASRLLALALLVALAGSCGGGTPDNPPCPEPGTLRALAVQGEDAPGTAGDYGPFAAAGLAMDVATNGWSVFVASTTDAAVPVALFVARPDGVVLLVWKHGETVPDADGGTISGFSQQPIEVTSDGRILCRVSIVGDLGGRTFGLLSARVDGASGAVIDKHDVVYSGQDMSASGVAGTLTTIFDATTFQADDGRVFFHGETSTGVEGFWRANADGSDLTLLVFETQSVPGGANITEIETLGIDSLGTRFAVVVTRSSGGSGVYSAAPGGPLSFLAEDGQPLPAFGGGTILDVWDSGPLIVYSTGAVVWQGTGSKTAPDDLLFYNVPGASGLVLARSGDLAGLAGGSKYSTLELLNHQRSPTNVLFRTTLVEGPLDGVFVIYAILAVGASAVPVVADGTAAPLEAGGGTFTEAFAALSVSGRDDVTHDGTLAFANLLSTGKSGLFWIIANCDTFSIAVQDTPAPGGDTFGVFYPNSAHTAADGVVLFRALLNTAGSGLFRQGP